MYYAYNNNNNNNSMQCTMDLYIIFIYKGTNHYRVKKNRVCVCVCVCDSIGRIVQVLCNSQERVMQMISLDKTTPVQGVYAAVHIKRRRQQ